VRIDTRVKMEIRIEARARIIVKMRMEAEWVHSMYSVEINK
jgi:hypothetical protein